MPQLAAQIWADGPSATPFEPPKPDIREWGTWIEQIIAGIIANGSHGLYQTRASLFADLAHPANYSAWVFGDPTVAYNGLYMKVGAAGTGSWTRVGDLPYSFITAYDVGAGTPNAIQATTSIPITESALVIANVFEANTGSPVTISFNGGGLLTIKTNSGNNIAPGGLVADMRLLGVVSGSTFRLVSDQASSAIIAIAEGFANAAAASAAAAAASAAGVNLPPVTANTMLVDNAGGTARESKTFTQVAGLLLASSATRGRLPTVGYAGTDIRFLNAILFANELQSGSGAKAANSAQINALALDAYNAGGGVVVIPPGTWYVAGLKFRDGVMFVGSGRRATILMDNAADSVPIFQSNNTAVTCLWAGVTDMQINKPNAANGMVIVDMTSCQFFTVSRNWISGKSALGVLGIGCRGLYTTGPLVFTTEGTYGFIEGNYIGLVCDGVRLGPNANAIIVRGNRIQPSFNGGIAFRTGSFGDAQLAQASFPNQVTFMDNAVEYPAGLGVSGMRAYYIEGVSKDIHIIGGRVEGGAISDAVYVEAGASGSVQNLHVSDITGKKVNGISPTFVSYDGDDGFRVTGLLGEYSINGVTGAKVGRAHNLVGSRGSAGVYNFSFAVAMPDANYKVSATIQASAVSSWRVTSKSTTGFTISTFNSAGTANDVLGVDVWVSP